MNGHGGRRLNAGPKPRSLASRLLTNARLRPEADAQVTPFPAPAPGQPVRDWVPTAAQRRSLGRRGKAFLTHRLSLYGFTPAEGDLLLRACRSLDEADLWRRRSHSWKTPADAARAARLQLQFERAFVTALSMLKETK